MRFYSANKTAREEHIPITLIRRMIADETCPGFYSGNRFYVNVDLLLAKLDAQSRANDKSGMVAAVS